MKRTPTTHADYIAAADASKRPALVALDRLIRRTLPELAPCIVHGMLGYGPYHYRYDSGREGDSARIALSSNKTGFSIYVSAVDDRGYLAERARTRLGKAVVGKSCIRFKRIEDLHLDALRALLLETRRARQPGHASSDTGPKKKTPGSAALGTRAASASTGARTPARRKPTARSPRTSRARG